MVAAVLARKLKDGRIECTACSRYCKLKENQIGLCGVRQNVKGQLDLLVYGKVAAVHIDPIEKKPVTHFRPGTRIFSIGTTGCNWLCKYCQNYDLSQRRKVEGLDMPPKAVVAKALETSCQGIAYTYNEPTIFMEFAHDTGVLARKAGLINIFVSNGFETKESVKLLPDFLDAITVDFKGNGNKTFLNQYVGILGPEPIFEALLLMKKLKIHIEITDLVVPKVGDNLEDARKLAQWVYDNLGPEMPLHFLRFHPDYKMREFPATPVETLEKHHAVAKKVGLKYVYIGNVPGHPLEHTYCPSCNAVVVERFGFDVVNWRLDEKNRCPHCAEKIPIVGRPPSNTSNRFQNVY